VLSLNGVTESELRVFVVAIEAVAFAELTIELVGAGYRVENYGSTEDFLRHVRPDRAGCVVAGIQDNGMQAEEFQKIVQAPPHFRPIVFISSCCHIPTIVQVVRAGAVNYINWPGASTEAKHTLPSQKTTTSHLNALRRELIASVDKATDLYNARRRARDHDAEVNARQALLTSREREVMSRVVTGCPNKQIGFELGISETTVKVHRSHVMKKMGVTSVAQLVHLSRAIFMAQSERAGCQASVRQTVLPVAQADTLERSSAGRPKLLEGQ